MIDALLSYGPKSEMPFRAFALNLNLSADHITRLLNKKSSTVSIILASRYDLRDEHAMRILQDPRPTTRHAFLTRPVSNKIGAAKNRISPEALEYAMGQEWFTPDYSYATAVNFAQTLTGEQLETLEEMYGLKKVQLRHGPNAKPLFPQSAGFKRSRSMVRSTLQAADFESYLQRSGNSPIDPERLDNLLNMSCSNLLNSINRYHEPHRTFVAKIQELVGPVGKEFYDIFLETLPTWHGSILELISTTHCLTSSVAS